MVINFFGRRGTGKTTLIRENLNSYPGPVAVIDILGNFGDDTKYYVTSDLEEFLDGLKQWKIEPDEKDKIFVLQPSDPNTGLDFVSAAMWHLGGGTLVLDEVDGFNYASVPCFDQLVRYGRNRSVHLVTGCRRPAEIDRNITAGSNRTFIMRTQEPRDIEYFNKTILGERADALMQIPQFHGLFVDNDTNTISKFKFNEKGEIFILETEPFNT